MDTNTIHFSSLNRAGLSHDIIHKYQNTSKCKEFIGKYDRVLFPPIVLYKGTNTIADGIHRICAQLYHGNQAIQVIFYPDYKEQFREYLDHKDIDKDKSYNCILIDRSLPFKDKVLIMNQLLVSMFVALSNNIPEYKGNVNDQGIDIQLVYIMKELGNILGYLGNCSSMRDQNELMDYDQVELFNRISRLAKLINAFK